MSELVSKKKQIVEAYQSRCPSNFMTFLRGLVIPSATGPQLFNSCIAQFQVECFQVLAPSLHAVRDGLMPPKRRFWIERTKKAGKDSDLGVCLMWLVAFPSKPIFMQVGAADREQAAIIKRRITDIIYLNPWLNALIKVSQYKITSSNGMAMLDIMAADVAGSHGETPDVLVINELSHVTKWGFVENLLDNADGVPQGMVVIATNAGFKGTKAEVLRLNAVKSKDWTVRDLRNPAPWISKKDVEDARKRSTPSRYKRLWWGRWASGKGDALDEDDIDRCFDPALKPQLKPLKGWRYIAGLDLGISHDHSGLVVVGVHEKEQRVRTALMRSWEPPTDGEIDLQAVEEACYSASRNFRVEWFGYDPYEARLMAQRLRRRGIPMQEVSFAATRNLTAMAESLIQLVEAAKLECYEDPDGKLRRDFGKFNIVEKSYGCRLEAVSDEFGHADMGTALVITLPRAVSMLEGMASRLNKEDDLAFEMEESELSKKEFDEMPDEMKDIYEAYDEMDEEAKYRDKW